MAEIGGTFIGNVSLQNFILFIFVVIFTFIFGELVSVLVIKFLKDKVKPFVYKLLSRIARYGIYGLGLYFAFQKIIYFNIPAGLAAIGILGIALLLPMVPILQNIASGVVIAFERPFREEDIIEIDGKLCKVKDIMLRKTRLRSLDGKIIIVPNISFITGPPIINYTSGEFIKVILTVGIALDSDKDKATEIIKKICTENPNILPNVPEKKIDKISKIFGISTDFFKIPRNIKNLDPKIMIKNINKDKIEFEVWFWIWDILTREKIISSFYSNLLQEFNKEGVKFG